MDGLRDTYTGRACCKLSQSYCRALTITYLHSEQEILRHMSDLAKHDEPQCVHCTPDCPGLILVKK